MSRLNRFALSQLVSFISLATILAQPAFASTQPVTSSTANTRVLSIKTSKLDALKNLTKYVNPLIGSENNGNTFPGASAPFGMLQWSPDNSTLSSGYSYWSNTITGFSLTHLNGVGCNIFGDIPFMVYSGNVNQSPVSSPSTYAMNFNHANETASPGYYGVKLDSGIQVQLTATTRTGYGRFTFPIGKPASILINTSGSLNGNSNSTVQIVGNNEVMGSATSGHFGGNGDVYTVYFVAQFSQPFTQKGTWTGSSLSNNTMQASGAKSGAYLTFAPGAKVDVKVGISYVSTQNALLNLQTEDPGWSFSQIQSVTQAAWNQDLNKIQVTSSDPNELTTFYTALYHALLSPNTFSDVNGQYIGFDNQIHNAGSQTQYANFSGWDIYRSEMQLLAFLMPNRASDMIQSLVRDGEQGGALPKWPVANGYSGVMDGDSADPIIAEAYALGARNFDTQAALQLMIKGATVPGTGGNNYQERPGLKQYLSLGYIPASRGNWATSATLEYAIDDSAIGQFAKALGQPSSVYQPFFQRGQNWQNVINPATGLAQPKLTDGSFMANYEPSTHANFIEGSAYQYRWMVPQDFTGLSRLLGGKNATVNDLNSFFTQLNAGWDSTYAWMGNEPSITAPYAYDFIGHASNTQNIVRQTVNQLFTNTQSGIPGNDDLGTMSAWYVWATLGIYPVVPGVSGFALSSPLFSSAVIHWNDNQNTLTINGTGASQNSPYVQNFSINGSPFTSAWMPLSQIASSNTTMNFILGATPSNYLHADNSSASTNTISAKLSSAKPADSFGLQPVFPFSTNSQIQAKAGSTVNFAVGMQGNASANQPYRLSLYVPSPLKLANVNEVTTTSVADAPISVFLPSNAPNGVYPVKVLFQKIGLSTASNIQPVTVDIVVTGGSNDLFGYYNNVGISNDQNANDGNFDGGQRTYSQNALASQGFVAGKQFSVSGVNFIWPQFATGSMDNIIANGQTINFTGSGSNLVIIGSSTNGNTEGSLIINYTDGSSSTETLGLSDWTLNGGGSKIAFGNTPVVVSPYRNNVAFPANKENVTTYLFSATIPLEAGKSIQSIQLPNPQGQGAMHIFMMGTSH